VPRWLPQALERIRAHAERGELQLTVKALNELHALGLGLDVTDLRDALEHLSPGESDGRHRSDATGEWLYVFKPRVLDTLVYLKVALRAGCIVISFHKDEPHGES